MKIGIVVESLLTCGGTERQVVRLSIELTKLGQEVTIYTRAYDPVLCYPEHKDKIKVVSLPEEAGGKSKRGGE